MASTWRQAKSMLPFRTSTVFRNAGLKLIFRVCSGSDHEPAVRAKDRLGPEEPNNEGENVLDYSHSY
jgi:hypothetical protein